MSRTLKLYDNENGTGLYVSTISEVHHSPDSYETAIVHPLYNDGKIIIVESYMYEIEALAGHDKWVNLMTSSVLPEYLDSLGKDVFTAMLTMLNGSVLRHYKDFSSN